MRSRRVPSSERRLHAPHMPHTEENDVGTRMPPSLARFACSSCAPVVISSPNHAGAPNASEIGISIPAFFPAQIRMLTDSKAVEVCHISILSTQIARRIHHTFAVSCRLRLQRILLELPLAQVSM